MKKPAAIPLNKAGNAVQGTTIEAAARLSARRADRHRGHRSLAAAGTPGLAAAART